MKRSPTHVADLRRSGHKVVLASYTRGARERLAGLLEDHGLKAQKLADSWQEALGSKTQPALLVLPLDHGFTTPDVAVLTEQDMLGDRLVRRRKKRKAAGGLPRRAGDALARRPRRPRRPRHRPLRGPDPDPGQQGPARLRRARICARQQALCAGREYRAADAATAARAKASTLDSLGGEAWQRRKSRMKERIREIAGELIKVAALRATRPGVIAEAGRELPRVRRPLPLRGNRRPGTRDRRRACRTSRPASRWTGWCAATSASARPRSRCAPPSSWRCRASRSR